MPSSSLPLDIKELLMEHIESVSQLEVLFIFFIQPDRHWTAKEVSQEQRSHPTSIARQIIHLEQHGFLARVGSQDLYSFQPKNDELRAGTARLYEIYKERQVAVISFIYEKPNDKLKGFADAFKFKKD